MSDHMDAYTGGGYGVPGGGVMSESHKDTETRLLGEIKALKAEINALKAERDSARKVLAEALAQRDQAYEDAAVAQAEAKRLKEGNR